ncbi:MAG: DNA-processing protein DprA [Muribaculaceae bacterium]|nr:DNA-processing protein DprA [Muribaculaceae bacterium]
MEKGRREERSVISRIGLSFLKKINLSFLQHMEEKEISPEEFFLLTTKELITKLGISQNHDFDTLNREEAYNRAKKEFEAIRRHNIQPLFILDEDYPSRLAEIEDAPVILYKLGDADLESEHIVSVVGTRKPTPYGVEFCNRFLSDTGDYFPDAIIVSGLAYGVDAAAHTKALEKGLSTVAVMAHGLNMIYPAAHRNLAKEIIRNGGAILSEYPFGTTPYKPHFLARNRIVAGISDVTVVVESNIKGGAMSTANFAFVYNREVMALPGRSTDELSSGCNLLIRKNKARLIECVADMIEATGWQPLNIPVTPNQRNLFPELEGKSRKIYEILQYSKEPVQIDNICQLTGLPASKLNAILNELEFEGVITRYPGNRYSI